MHFDQLGAARYLTRLSADGAVDDLHDRYQECVARVADYDARKHTTLLHTLETYLSCGGNIARAAEQLYVHRNTLVQRLDKLQELVGLDPHDATHWLPLHIALGLWRLREP
jgi:DNA-binding PucR family transcriptional regulator